MTSKPWRKALEGLGLGYVTARQKTIPAAVWEENAEVRGAFLQGLFDADGYCGGNRRVVLCTASETMAEEVQEMLLSLGVVSTRRWYATGEGYGQVYVNADCFNKFRLRVGFSHKGKAAALANGEPNRALRPALGFDFVAEVQPLPGTISMIDVEVPAPHMLNFGPFFGHNSQGLSMDLVQVDFRDHFYSSCGMLYVALSRARTGAGLRIVGRPQTFVARCNTDKRLEEWT
jgi:hypothetical protein